MSQLGHAHYSYKFANNANSLGMSGWMSDPDTDTDANVGLHDCIAAGQWITKYIDRFGGDPKQVTAIGQSSGAGILSIMLTLDGGRGSLHFQQVRKDLSDYSMASLS